VKKDVLLRNWNLFGLVKNWRQYLLETSEGNDDFLAWNKFMDCPIGSEYRLSVSI